MPALGEIQPTRRRRARPPAGERGKVVDETSGALRGPLPQVRENNAALPDGESRWAALQFDSFAGKLGPQ